MKRFFKKVLEKALLTSLARLIAFPLFGVSGAFWWWIVVVGMLVALAIVSMMETTQSIA